MKYFYISKNNILNKVAHNDDSHLKISNCVKLENQSSFALIMCSAFGGDYPVSDVEPDSRQPGSSLKRFLVLYSNNQAVACARYLKLINNSGESYIILCDLGVKKELQGKGLGQKMFSRRILYIIKNEEFSHVFSEIEDDNYASIAISKKFGLKNVTDSKFIYQFPEIN
ncbi:MAG: GNAT family N-acetyltransferase [Bacteriovoracaceae bacterium]|nr:GNAT family N-acetyltransferase [Bacteriovoracaceae bacterium]